MAECPMLKKCKEASGINCEGRNFDGKQLTRSPRFHGDKDNMAVMDWLDDLCAFYEKLVHERKTGIKP